MMWSHDWNSSPHGQDLRGVWVKCSWGFTAGANRLAADYGGGVNWGEETG